MRIVYFLIILFALGCSITPGANFETLDLSNKSLSAIPDSVFSHKKLEVLYLGNEFTLYPPLSALKQDSTSSPNMNHITSIPEEIGKLKRLRVLDISANDISSLPGAITKLEQLDTLNISFNKHLHIAKELPILEKLQSLRWLNIVGTEFDEKTLAHLRQSLYKTRIITSFDDLEYDASK